MGGDRILGAACRDKGASITATGRVAPHVGTETLTIYVIRGRDTTRTGVLIDRLAVDTAGGGPRVVRVYRSVDQVLGQRLDTIVGGGWLAAHRVPQSGVDWFRASRVRARPRHGRDGPRQRRLHRDRRAAPANVYNGASFDLVLRASPLSDAFEVTVPGFLAGTRSVTPLSARVTGVGAIAGHDCWVVSTEFAGLPVTFWIDVATRQLRQQVMHVRADMQILFAPPKPARAPRRAT